MVASTPFQPILALLLLLFVGNAFGMPHHNNHNGHGPGHHGLGHRGGPGGAGGVCVLDVNCRHGEICDFGRCIHGHRESVLRAGPGRRAVACFHGSSQVRLEDGTSKQIDKVQAGESVASVNDEGEEIFVDVVYVPHLQNRIAVSFLKLTCTEGVDGATSTIFMTPEHFIFRSSAGASFDEAVPVRADELKVGDWLWRVESSSDFESSTSPCEIAEDVPAVNDLEGAYTLFTENGRFIVDNLVVSSYAGSSSAPLQYYGHDLAHQAMLLHRVVHFFGQSSSTWFRYANENILVPLAAV